MADKKISQLPVATSSSGTDVLPIVQSNTTKQLAIANLVPQNLKSNATTGLLQVTGPAAESTRVMTTPDANFTVARTDAANSFTGDQTLATGNLIIGTSGKGIDFSATPDATATSELLSDYEEGTWTPSVGGTATYSSQLGKYTKIGRQVSICGRFGITAIGTGSTTTISGLPYAMGTTGDGTLNVSYFANAVSAVTYITGYTSGTTLVMTSVGAASTNINNAASTFRDGTSLIFQATYFI